MTPDRPIAALFAQQRPLRSLEFFPPKDDEGVANLRATATALKRIAPDFVSVTYGAGGTTRERTAQVSALLKDERHRFLADEWPKVYATIARLGLSAPDLLNGVRPAPVMPPEAKNDGSN